MTQHVQKPTLIVEARYWPMNARIVDRSLLATALEGLTLRRSPVVGSERAHPLDRYNDRQRNILHLEISSPSELSVDHKVPPGLQLSRMFFRLWDIGIFSTYTLFETRSAALQASHIDSHCAAAIEVVDDLQADLVTLFDTLAQREVITVPEDHLFGVPTILTRLRRHSPLESYRYSNHVFFGRQDQLKAALRHYGCDGEDPAHIDGVHVYLGWATYLWDTWAENATATAGQLEQRLAIDYLGLSEAVVYENATECNRAYLDAILTGDVADVELDSSRIRHTTLLHHRLLLEIRLWKSLLDAQMQHIHQRVRTALLLEQGKESFESSDSVLRYAVDGLDVRQKHEADRLLAVALGIFTALTAFSAAADLNTLLTDDGQMELRSVLVSLLEGPFSLRTLLLAMATTGAGVALALLATDRAVRRRFKGAFAGVRRGINRALSLPEVRRRRVRSGSRDAPGT